MINGKLQENMRLIRTFAQVKFCRHNTSVCDYASKACARQFNSKLLAEYAR